MDNGLLMLTLPEHSSQVMETVKKLDWFIHYFNLDSESNIYTLENYLYNNEVHGIEYHLVLDLNLYQFIVNAVKKQTNHNNHRYGIALVAFCHFAKIQFDTTYPVYEKLNYDKNNLSEVLDDLNLFRCIEHSKTQDLVNYATGVADELHIPENNRFNRGELGEQLTKHIRLTHWDSFYLFILAITSIKQDKEITNKIKYFTDWMNEKFFFSAVILTYAIVYFGKRPIAKMMKYKSTDSKENKIKSITNMTWDLFLMNGVFEKWKKKSSKQEYIFASDDKAFKQLLTLAIKTQNTGGLDHFLPHISQHNIDYINKFTNQKYLNSSERQLYMNNQSSEKRKDLIMYFKELLSL